LGTVIFALAATTTISGFLAADFFSSLLGGSIYAGLEVADLGYGILLAHI